METEERPRLHSPNRAARLLDLSRSKTYDLMKTGKLRFVMIDNERRIPDSEIERLTRAGTETEAA